MKKPKTISIDELDRFGIDDDGKLYWDGKPVITGQEIKFQTRVNFAVFFGSVATVIIAIVNILLFAGYGACLK